MNIPELFKLIQKPSIYFKGDSVMWTDGHSS